MCFILYNHVIKELILFSSTNFLGGSNSEFSTWVKMVLFLLPIYLLCRWLIKESDLKALTYEEEKIKKGNIWLVIYIIISVTLLVILILYKKENL